MAEEQALSNSVVLRNIFSHCPYSVLANFRLVSKLWYDESLDLWRKSARLVFSLVDGQLSMCYVGVDGSRSTLPFQQLLDYAATLTILRLENHPHRTIQLRDSTISAAGADSEILDRFWAVFGQSTVRLELISCTFLDVDGFRRLIYLSVPNLKHLVIRGCNFSAIYELNRMRRPDSVPPLIPPHYPARNLQLISFEFRWLEWERGLLPVSWHELFTHFPKMSSFSIPYYVALGEEQFHALLASIWAVRQGNGAESLPFRHFDIGGISLPTRVVTLKLLNSLKALSLPIDMLDVRQTGAEPDIAEFGHAVRLFSDTLREMMITLTRPWIMTSEFPFGHQLDNLSRLTVTGTISNDLSLLRFMPNLCYLYLDGRRSNRFLQLEPTRHLQMTKLTVLRLWNVLQNEDIPLLSSLMPSVVDLSIDLDDIGFLMICEHFTGLEKLHVFGTELSDEGLLGHRNGDGPNVSYLQKLRIFKFDTDQLSGRAVIYGLLGLPKLAALMRNRHQRTYLDWGRRVRDMLLERGIQLFGPFFADEPAQIPPNDMDYAATYGPLLLIG